MIFPPPPDTLDGWCVFPLYLYLSVSLSHTHITSVSLCLCLCVCVSVSVSVSLCLSLSLPLSLSLSLSHTHTHTNTHTNTHTHPTAGKPDSCGEAHEKYCLHTSLPHMVGGGGRIEGPAGTEFMPQEDQEFKAILSYADSSKSAWATQYLVSKKKKKVSLILPGFLLKWPLSLGDSGNRPPPPPSLLPPLTGWVSCSRRAKMTVTKVSVPPVLPVRDLCWRQGGRDDLRANMGGIQGPQVGAGCT